MKKHEVRARNEELVEMSKTMHYTDIAIVMDMTVSCVYDSIRKLDRYWKPDKNIKPKAINVSLAEQDV